MRRLFALAALALAAPALAQAEPVTPDSVVAEASPEEWIAIDVNDLLVMELAPEVDGTPREVVIQLMPPPFSQPWVENIRTLARTHWWDGTSVYRVVDNWVAQWGDVSEEKVLPVDVKSPVALYGVVHGEPDGSIRLWHPRDYLEDAYSDWSQFHEGWPFSYSISEDTSQLTEAPIHCYASVGVARGLAPDTGTGSELYAIIGHAPRQLDRNIAVVGRVIDGIEYLSTLKRGTGEAGVYESRAEATPIISVRLGSELPDPPGYEYLDTASDSFARYVEVRANRNDPFYTVPAGGVDICNVQVPIRPVPEDRG
jgi:peptidylprolyl isomerase